MARTKQKARKHTASRLNETTKPERATVNSLKKRIRDLKRRQARANDIPADVQVAHERELQTCQDDLKVARERMARKTMIEKYHMVRFFERKRADKLLKRARARLATATEETPAGTKFELERDVHNCKVDLNYALFYPLERAYSSLYTKRQGGDDDKPAPTEEEKEEKDGEMDDAAARKYTINRDQPMWKVVEQCMEDGNLQALRDGQLDLGDDLSKKTKKKSEGEDGHSKLQNERSKHSNKSARTQRVEDEDEDMDDMDDDETGVGFFEK